jgi:hypothetical protein
MRQTRTAVLIIVRSSGMTRTGSSSQAASRGRSALGANVAKKPAKSHCAARSGSWIGSRCTLRPGSPGVSIA